MNNLKNISILKYGLLIVALCLVMSIIYYMQFPIDEIVFLEHYYEISLYGSSTRQIHFISNSNDKRKIVDISFPQLPDDFADVFSEYFNYGNYRSENFAHYNHNVILLNFVSMNNYAETEPEKSIFLDKALISFDSGEQQEVDIGKIILRKNIKQSDALNTPHSSVSNNSTSMAVIKSNENIIIEKITSDFLEETKGILQLQLNHVLIDELNYPLIVADKDSLEFDSQFIFNSNDMRKYNVYDIKQRIYLRDGDHNLEYYDFHNLIYEPNDLFNTEKVIIKYLKYKGVK